VTTFNEWGEGTSVESAQEWSSASGYGSYLDVLHNNPGPGGTVNTPPSTTTTTMGPVTTTTLGPTTTTTAPATTTTTAPPPPPPAGSGPCGTRSIAPATYAHVIWVWMENKHYTDVINNAAAPYQTQLSQQCGTATHYATVGSPSLPNYIGAVAGQTFGIADDNAPSSHVLTADNLFRQVRSIGGTSRTYSESMTSNCQLSSSGTYAVKHNPAAYFTGADDRTVCTRDNLPLGTTTSGGFLNDLNNNTLASFTLVVPNLCSDTHDCSVATGDNWLKGWMPKILGSAAYQSGNTAVVLMYDEYTSLPNVFITPSTRPGTVLTATVNHYALLRSTEEMLGIPTFIAGAATAPSLRASFNM